MIRKSFTDKATVASTRRTEDGFMIADAFVARTGVQEYLGTEVDEDNALGLRDKPIVRVYRSPEAVRDSLTGFSHAPITIGHPSDLVDAKNWKDLAVGEVSTEATWDGQRVRLPLILKDHRGIDAVSQGHRELSAGYTSGLIVKDGVSPEGEAYDAEQVDIKINHVALVPRGRAGSDFRIPFGDKWGSSATPIQPAEEESPMLRKVLVDGLTVETTDAGAQAIEKLQKQLNDQSAEHQKIVDAKDREIARVEGERDEAMKKVIGDAEIDARVKARSTLIGDAQKVVKDADFAGKSDQDIRRAVVASKMGDKAIEGKSDAYIEAKFEHYVELADAEASNKPDQVLTYAKDAAPVNGDGGWGTALQKNGIK